MIKSAAATRPAIPPHLTFDDMITLLACLELIPSREVLLPACGTCARSSSDRR